MIMEAIDLKQELKTLIEKENDLHILEAIKTILVKSSLDPVLKEKLTSRALKAEEDIRAGRVYTREEFEKKLDNKLGLWELFFLTNLLKALMNRYNFCWRSKRYL